MLVDSFSWSFYVFIVRIDFLDLSVKADYGLVVILMFLTDCELIGLLKEFLELDSLSVFFILYNLFILRGFIVNLESSHFVKLIEFSNWLRVGFGFEMDLYLFYLFVELASAFL